MLDKVQDEDFARDYQRAGGIQHIICSATLTIDKAGRVTPRSAKRDKNKKVKGDAKPEETTQQTIEAFCKLLRFRSKNPKVIDLTSEERMPETLSEKAIKCNKEEKDLFMYYCL